MKKILAMLLTVAMVLSLAVSAFAQEAAFQPYTYDDQAVYDGALGDFYAALQEAKECVDVDEMYAKMAIAEAKMLEAAINVPFYSDGGNYGITHITPRSIPSVMWGSDIDRYDTAIVTNELLKVEDRAALTAMWHELAGTGTYEQSAKDYLTEKGYTFTDEFVYAYSSDPETWDPLTAWTNTVGEPSCLILEGLVRYNMENTITPALAESWECSEDGLTWTFHLKSGLTWVDSQGRKLDDIKADDWVASAQHLLDWYGDSAAEVLAPMLVNGLEYVDGTVTDFSEVGVEAVDDLTLVYHLTAPVPAFESMLTYCGFFSPLCRSYFVSQGGTFGPEADNGNYGTDPDHMAYCGSYLVTSYTKTNTIVYEANPAYWNAGNLNINKVTFRYYDGTDPLATYNDCVAGTLSSAGLGTSALQKCKDDGRFEEYANIYGALSGTTRQALFCINRQMYHNFNDETAAVSPQTHDSIATLDKANGVVVADASIVDDAARTHVAMNNQNFRLALACGWDKASYRAQMVGEDLKNVSLRNTYTPGDFVKLGKEVTVSINGTDTTFAAGTYYGAMVQAQIDADGYKLKVWDPEANEGAGSSDGFDGWYNVEAAQEYLAKAVEELAAQGVEITAENPIQIDYINYSAAESMNNRANAYKQNIERDLKGLVQVNLVDTTTQDALNYATFWNSTGAEFNSDMCIGQAWSADYGDPASYLMTFAPAGDGYMCKNIGLW